MSTSDELVELSVVYEFLLRYTLISLSPFLQLLDKLLPRLRDRGSRVLLFSQFTTGEW